jgi:hypothetical protein
MNMAWVPVYAGGYGTTTPFPYLSNRWYVRSHVPIHIERYYGHKAFGNNNSLNFFVKASSGIRKMLWTRDKHKEYVNILSIYKHVQRSMKNLNSGVLNYTSCGRRRGKRGIGGKQVF